MSAREQPRRCYDPSDVRGDCSRLDLGQALVAPVGEVVARQCLKTELSEPGTAEGGQLDNTSHRSPSRNGATSFA